MNSDREPLYVQIQNHFKDEIRTGRLLADDKIPTEKELLEQFDVSRITVANALSELAREGWIYRIPGRGTYVKCDPEGVIVAAAAAALESAQPAQLVQPMQAEKRRERPKVGLIIPSVSDYFAIRLLAGITDSLESGGCSLSIMFTFNSKEREKELIRELRDSVDGLIIFPVDADVYNEEIITLKMNGYPFVLIDRYLPGVETNTVHADSALAAKLAVDHLWSLGHRNIAICTDTPLSAVSVDDRINGYMNALKEKEALINPALLLTNFDVRDAGLDADHPLVQLITSRAATAYIALNSTLGLHIAAVAKAAGLNMPGDLSVVTFDNPSRGMLDEQGIFTYIDQHEGEIGRRAGELMAAILQADGVGSVPAYNRIVLEPMLVVRGTTAAPRE
ncbi:GntR family transcriptional regulator [Paenibacillus sp. R14(2021)]|uniref:GntR family transcriptional regulator n=1 Tax=Paenibacillus sp. R14(2021) TaxID=2859228 RepID=UPI001C615959|nr:GntR family transcriptional regulator [Paenibacillus sp. R14(2021)]